MHPVTGADPAELRWVVPAGAVPVAGPVAAAPGALGGLLGDGTLARVVAEPRAVVTRLGAGHSWPADGARVRTALHEALATPAGWTVRATADRATADRATPTRVGDAEAGPGTRTGLADGSGRDATLRAAAEDVLAGPVGDLARSHGGHIELADVRDGVVEVRMSGACHGCPAAAVTMHARLERLVRERCDGLVEVREVGAPTRARFWLSLARRGAPPTS
ncbi:NifU family protein [Georgenia ruanii]|uniref:NifU family protein n=2 Tax=Georgenia ruanii TaxID=348442 RepID=A0A7J9URX4_9MICO|nr:NifU family protein [Georgenia ruanii]